MEYVYLIFYFYFLILNFKQIVFAALDENIDGPNDIYMSKLLQKAIKKN